MAFAMGISVEEFKHMTPYKLECCLKGHRMNRQMRDEEMWYLGQYVMSALDSTVCNSLLWRKKGSKPHEYIEKPILSEIEKKTEKNKPMTEEEKKKQTEALFMKLRIMGANFNLNKEKRSEHEGN